MRVAPVSGDLLVKLALGALVIGAAVWAVRRTAAAVPDLSSLPGRFWNTATDAAYAVAPWNQNNVLYQTANSATSAVLGREEILGGWLRDVFNPDPMAMPAPATPSARPWDADNPLQNDSGMNFGYF